MVSTIHDVAKLAGVHSSTVSRALSGKASITDEIKGKIYAGMKPLDYHPSSVARSLAMGLDGTIALVVDAGDTGAFSNVFFSRSLLAIERIAHARDYHVIIVIGGKGAAESIGGAGVGKEGGRADSASVRH